MKWNDNIWNEIDRLEKRIDRLFGKGRGEMIEELSTTGYRRASANFNETDKEFVVQVEIPGINKEDIQLNVVGKGLEIKAEKRKERELGDKEGKEYSYTKSYAGYYQAFDVPDNADLENVSASYKNGVLVIKLPKKSDTKDKKIIQID